jgi:hypothetical protein
MIQSPPKILSRDAKVGELIDQDTYWWNKSLIDNIFTETDSVTIQPIPVSYTNRPDIQIWRRTLNGVFSVRSAYHLAKEKEDGRYPESSLRKEISVI